MLQALYKNDNIHHAVSVNCQPQSRLNRPANRLCYKLSRQRQNVPGTCSRHREGAIAEMPNVERRVGGTISVDVEADRRHRQTSTCRTLLISRRQSRITYCAWLLVWRITLIIISPHGALCYAKLDFNIMHRIILSWIIACRNRNCRNSACRNNACRNSACRNRNCLPKITVSASYVSFTILVWNWMLCWSANTRTSERR